MLAHARLCFQRFQGISHPVRSFFWITFLKAFLLVMAIILLPIGLSPDEAQYWTWSQDLDWGYYSKPPGIAWQIALTTKIFGNTVLGVRMGAVLIGSLLAWSVFILAKACGLNSKKCFWAATCMALSPIGVYLTFAATTDGASILFLTLAITLVANALHKEQIPRYLAIGFLIGLGALFKWTTFIFWPFVWISAFLFPYLRHRNLVLGMAISLFALVPTLYWNAGHEWVTFKHVAKTVTSTHKANPVEFFLGQIALFSPLYFLIWIMSLSRKKTAPLFLCTLISFAGCFYLVAACFKKMQLNWPAYLYPSAMVLIAWRGKKTWLVYGTVLTAFIVFALFFIPSLQKKSTIPFSLNPFQQCMGGPALSAVLKQTHFDAEKHFLFSDKYQTASLLSFYNDKKKRAYFLNVSGQRQNQFSYWPTLRDEQIDKSGYFVVIEKTRNLEKLKWTEEHYEKLLAPYFKTVEVVGYYPLFSTTKSPELIACVFICDTFCGQMPQGVDKF